jgi:hypothetical protein
MTSQGLFYFDSESEDDESTGEEENWEEELPPLREEDEEYDEDADESTASGGSSGLVHHAKARVSSRRRFSESSLPGKGDDAAKKAVSKYFSLDRGRIRQQVTPFSEEVVFFVKKPCDAKTVQNHNAEDDDDGPFSSNARVPFHSAVTNKPATPSTMKWLRRNRKTQEEKRGAGCRRSSLPVGGEEEDKGDKDGGSEEAQVNVLRPASAMEVSVTRPVGSTLLRRNSSASKLLDICIKFIAEHVSFRWAGVGSSLRKRGVFSGPEQRECEIISNK